VSYLEITEARPMGKYVHSQGLSELLGNRFGLLAGDAVFLDLAPWD